MLHDRCPSCGHAARPSTRCTVIVDDADWAAAGGIGPVTRCGCRAPFHNR